MLLSSDGVVGEFCVPVVALLPMTPESLVEVPSVCWSLVTGVFGVALMAPGC